MKRNSIFNCNYNIVQYLFYIIIILLCVFCWGSTLFLHVFLWWGLPHVRTVDMISHCFWQYLSQSQTIATTTCIIFCCCQEDIVRKHRAIVVEDWYNLYNKSKLLRFFIHFCLLLTTTQYQSVSDSLPYNRSFLILTLVGQFPRPRLWCDLQNTSTEHRF